MQRRTLNRLLTLAAAPLLAGPVRATATVPSAAWREIEAPTGGRLGVAVFDAATGRLEGHRLDERFAMCSTFKWLLGAMVLRRVDQGRETLQDRLAPDGTGATLADLCAMTITVSDNTAANQLLAHLGGPAAVTRYARSLGDTATRLDRVEPLLNEARPGDRRDTTTPRAMVTAMRCALLGGSARQSGQLSSAGRAQLSAWLEATTTGAERLRAGMPSGWRIGDKTGTGGYGSTNDVAILMPPEHAPVIVAAYLTETTIDPARRNAALAEVGRTVATLIGQGR